MKRVGSVSSSETPGALLRLSAGLGALATGLVVTSAVLELGAAHWGIAGVALPFLVADVVLARTAYPALLGRSVTALALFLLAIALGGVVAWSGSAGWAVALHVGAAGLALGAALLVLVSVRRGRLTPVGSARDYLTLTKPRIMSLLLVTGACGMFVGAQGVPPLWLFAVTMTGLALACGGASALNHVLDRDIDALMGSRTKARPVAAGRISPAQALEFGIFLSALSFALLASAVNVLTAVLALVGNLFYVLVYTRWLKRTTPQNIVIGGAAGAVPPLVGYAAATGSLALPALWLFLDRVPLDAAALLGARTDDQKRVRGRRRPDAPGRSRRRRDRAADPPLLHRARRVHDRRRNLARAALHGGCAGARGGLRRSRSHAAPRPDPGPRAGAVPLLARVPRAALRRRRRRPAADVSERTHEEELELQRRNLRFGWALTGLFVLLFAGTVLIALLFLQLD